MNYFTRISTAVMTLTIVVSAGYGIGIKSAEAATETFNSSTSWTVPADVCSVTVHVWGGGGGGAAAVGGGGGGGAFASSSLSVIPGQSHTVTVGLGGGTQIAGGNSWFSTADTVLAVGGGGASGAAGGAGGAAGSSIGTLTRSGGAGGAAQSGGSPGSRVGGGGGGSATVAANGGAGADGASGGAGGTGEGAGGAGNSGAGNGVPGTAPGGAGGGGGNNGGAGAGAAGRIVLTYFTDPGCYVPPTLTLSGTLYSDEGVTPITTGKTINLAVGTTTTSVFSTTTVSGAGTYSFTIPANSLDPGDPIAIWLDGDATKASLISTIGASTTQSVTGLDLYSDTVIVRNGSTASTTNAAVVEFYDNADDADLQYAASSTGATFSVLGGQTFYLWEGYRFQAPASTTYSGSFHNDSGTYLAPTGTTTFTGTSATISGTTTATSSLGNVVFTGSYTMSNATDVSDITINGGATLTAPSSTLGVAGNFQNNGTFTNNGGVVEFTGPTDSIISGSLTGSSAFHDLVVVGGVVQPIDPLTVNDLRIEGGSSETLNQLTDPGTMPPAGSYGIDFSSDGTYLAVGHFTSPFITIYKRSGDTFTKLADPASLPPNVVYDTEFSADGVYLSTVSNAPSYLTIYKRSGDTFTKLADPATLPTGSSFGTSFSADGTYLSVAHSVSPFITIYKRSGDTFTKLADPATLPPGGADDTAFSADGTYLSVAHSVSPFITIYKRSGDTFTKLADPASLPPNNGQGVSFSPDGTYLSVTHPTSPFITIYKRSGDTFTKLADPSALPTGAGQAVSFSPDNEYLTVVHFTTPFITIYKRSGDTFTKVNDAPSVPSTGGVAYSDDNQYMSLALESSPRLRIFKRSPGAQFNLSGALTISGDFSNTGAFTAATTSTVTLSGTNQTISSTLGTTTLHNLTKEVTVADTLNFTGSSSLAFTGELTLTGTAGNLLLLRSSTSGVPYYLDPQATTTVEYLDVQDAYNFATSAIDCTTGCVDSGNNTNWNFAGGGGGGGAAGITITGTLYQADGVTPIGAGRTIVAAVGTSTPSLHSTTTAADGSFSIAGIATSTVGTWATSSAVGNNDAWYGLTYGNGLFVAVSGGGDRVMTSPDGINWTARSAAGNNDNWNSVAYGNGLFVAVGSLTGDRVMTSPDGINWTARSAAGNNDNWQDVIYANGLFVAVGANSGDRVMTSPDGINWTARSAAGNNDAWYGLTYGNGLFVAVGAGGDYVMTSPDGINWNVRSAAGNNDSWNSVAYGNGLFVAVGGGGVTDKFMTSSNGTSWTVQSVADNDDGWRAVTYANGYFFAISAYSNDTIAYSSDGVSWITNPVAGGDDGWYRIVYGDGKLVAVGDNGDRSMYADAGFGEDTPITLFVDENATTSSSTATTLTYGLNQNAGTTTLQADLIADTLFLTKSQISSSTNEIRLSHADFYDSENDSDILFMATTSTTTINADLRIASGTVVYAPQHLVIDGDFDNYGTFEAERGEVIVNASAFDVMSAREAGMYNHTLSGTIRDMHVSSDGAKMYISNDSPSTIYEYDLSTLYDVSSATFLQSTTTSGLTNNNTGIHFTNDGMALFTTSYQFDVVNQYDLSTPWDISTLTLITSTSTTAQTVNPQALTFSVDGTKMYIGSPTDLYEYNVTTPWDVSTASFVQSRSGATFGVAFASDGLTLFIGNNSLSAVEVYTLSTAWDIGSASLIDTLDVSDGITSVWGVDFTPAGNRLYVVEAGPDDVYQYNLDQAQTFSGTMTGSSAFYNLTQDTFLPLTFAAAASTTGAYTITPESANAGATTTIFNAGSTYTFQNIDWTGVSSTTELVLRSSASGTAWYLAVPGTQVNVEFVNVQDSDATLTIGGISATSSTDSGNNTNWTFGDSASPFFASVANQQFYTTQASTSLNTITIIEPVSAATITAANDIRITIASTTDFRFTTGSTTPTFGGTAAGKVAATVSFEDGGTTLVVDVTTNFAASDTLTIGDIGIGSFGAVTETPGSLALHTDGDVIGSPAATDTYTITITGLLSQTAHPSGQVGNAFTSSSINDAALLAWELQSIGEVASVTELVVTLTAVDNLTAGDLTNLRLYRDVDDSQDFSGGDVAVGGAGSLNLGGGTITFSEAFTVATTAAASYILVADLNSLPAGAALTANLSIDGYTTVGSTTGLAVFGEAVAAVAAHERILVGMIRRGGGGARIGVAAPTGDTPQSGGGGGAGEAIDPNTGDSLTAEPGTYAPTIAGAFESGWTNGGNALTSDGVYATSNSVANNSYSTFNISLPSGDTIAGIIVRLEASATTPAGTIEVALSWDGGTSYTSVKSTPVLSATDAIYTLGGNSDLWGRSWTVANFSNENFAIRVIAQPDGNTVRIDALQVEPVHQAGGGGGGGGGRL